MACVASKQTGKSKGATVNKRPAPLAKKKKPSARSKITKKRKGFADPPKTKPRRATGKPSAELVEVLMLAGCSRERILELTGCKNTTLRESDYPDLRRGPRSAPLRTAYLLQRLLELGEASKSVHDVTHVLQIMARLHMPEIAAALGAGRSSDSIPGGGSSSVQLYLPDNGRGPGG